MKAGAADYKDTATRATGRSDGRDREVWMQFEPCCPDGVLLNVRRRAHGEKCAAGCPRAGGTIPLSRPATPRAPFASCLLTRFKDIDCTGSTKGGGGGHPLSLPLLSPPFFKTCITLDVMHKVAQNSR